MPKWVYNSNVVNNYFASRHASKLIVALQFAVGHHLCSGVPGPEDPDSPRVSSNHRLGCRTDVAHSTLRGSAITWCRRQPMAKRVTAEKCARRPKCMALPQHVGGPRYCLTMRRPYHHGDLREAILRRAMVKIEIDGLAALSLRDLARECGVSPSAPQKHFATKQDLLTALAVRGYDELADTLRDSATDGPIDKALTKFGQAYVAYVIEHPGLLQLMYDRRFDEGTNSVAEAATRSYAPIDEVLDRARARGEVVGSRKNVATFVQVLLHGLASSVSSGAVGAADQAVVRQVVNVSLSGLRPR